RFCTRYFMLLLLPDALPVLPNRRHAWHLYSVKLNLDRLRIDRARFLEELRSRNIGHAVHWKPLHMMPYYRDRYGLLPEHFPKAADRKSTRLNSSHEWNSSAT